jgi:putative DeoR family transcriptional regulator (stage III sporulation protein D)
MSATYDRICTRVLAVADHVQKTHDTVRATAKKFKVSKTTIHKDLKERLPIIKPQLIPIINKILEENLEDAPSRGGESTKKLWTA